MTKPELPITDNNGNLVDPYGVRSLVVHSLPDVGEVFRFPLPMPIDVDAYSSPPMNVTPRVRYFRRRKFNGRTVYVAD